VVSFFFVGPAEASEREFVGALDHFYPFRHDVLVHALDIIRQGKLNGGFHITSANCLIEDTYVADRGRMGIRSYVSR
jgi:hypothetical protein